MLSPFIALAGPIDRLSFRFRGLPDVRHEVQVVVPTEALADFSWRFVQPIRQHEDAFQQRIGC